MTDRAGQTSRVIFSNCTSQAVSSSVECPEKTAADMKDADLNGLLVLTVTEAAARKVPKQHERDKLNASFLIDFDS